MLNRHFGSFLLSRLVVFDAKTIRSDPYARINIDVLVPPVKPKNPAASFSREAGTRYCSSAYTDRFDRPQPKQINAAVHALGVSENTLCMLNAGTKPPVLGFSGSLCGPRVVRFPNCTVLGFAVLPQSSETDRAVAARCTVRRPHGRT